MRSQTSDVRREPLAHPPPLGSSRVADIPRKATTVDLKIFGIAELAITIIAVSIPILRVFIQQGHRSYFSKSSSVELSNQRSVSHGSSKSFSSYQESPRRGMPREYIKLPEPAKSHGGPKGRPRHEEV